MRLTLLALLSLCLFVSPSVAFLSPTWSCLVSRQTSACRSGTRGASSRLSAKRDQDPMQALSDAAKYYSGLANDPIIDLQVNEEKAKRDNLTPNLRLAVIFTVILGVLFNAFLDANKDIPPFTSL